MPPKQKKYLDFPAKIGLVIGLSLYFMVLPLMADKIYVSTQTGGQLGGLTFKNEDILKFDSADKSGGDKGTWSILFDGSNVGLSRHRIDGFYIADDYILLSFSSKPMIEIQGRKIRVGGSDIVKFNWDSLGEETTSGRFEMYFDGSDVGVKKNIDALSLDENGKLVFSVNRRNRLKQADGQSFIVRKQDLVRFTGTNGIDTVGSFERYLDGRKAGLRRLGEDIDGVDLDHSHVYLTTRGRFGVDAIKGRNEDILRCDLVSIPIEQCINPLIVFNGSDFEFSRENLQGIQVEITTIANDDEFTIGQNEVLTGANVMNDNGHGPDTDPQNDPLTVARVNGDPAKVNMTFSLESGALLKLQADGSITYDTHHRFDHLGASGQGQDRFDYRVVDGSGDYAEATVTIHVNGKNDAPTDIVLTGASAPENSPPGTVVGDFATTDPDEGDTHGYGLVSGVGDADNALFQVVGSQLQSAAVFDFETKASYSIRVRSSDAGGLPVDKQFTITVTDANDAPTDILLSSSVVPESQPIGSVVGTFSSTDIDASDTHTFSLAAGEGDSGNDSFQIIGNQLQTAAVFNSSAQSDYSIRVRSTDSASLTVEKQFSLTVVSINHAPSFTKGSDQIVDEDSGPVTVGAWAAAIDDGDSNAVQNLTFDITNNDNPALFSAGPAVSASGQLTYTPAADAHGSAVITLTLADDGGTANGGQDTSAPQSFTITVNSVNDRPDFSAVNPPAVDEDAGPQLVSSWASFSPGPGNESSQKISAYSVSGISNPALFGSQPAVAANGSLTYTPAADANGSATFQVTVKDDGGTVNGGIDTSLAKQFTVTVNAVDDPPVAVSDSASVSEDSGANPIAVLLNDTDVDGGTKLIGAVSKSTTGTVVITGGGTGLSYQPHPNYCNSLSNTPDTFTYTLTPGNSTAAVNVSVICVNDAPVAQNKTGVNIQANMKRTGIDAGLLSGITDPDAGVDGCTPVFSLASVNSVSGGTVSNVNSTAGTFDFEPNAGFTGSATVNYTIQD
ncbi:MAG: Ig-like domain-containing protein, partial [Gammaproteobacteria bacterium]